MAREISRTENWELVYQAFQQINFTGFDYNSVKQNLIDYLKLYFNEDFNDFIESSEMIAIIEAFAYIAELLAYRIDVASHENFIDTAQRKQSILRLAKLVAYKATRNLPAKGLVKITSISTSESIVDSRGTNLANRTIRWNDTTNSNWKEQFLLVMNRVLQQEFGSVLPSDRVQIEDVLLEVYSLENQTIANGVLPYSTSVSGSSYPMELVPVAVNESGPYERRPGKSDLFTILYANDGLGDSSLTTGFLCFTKQGDLQKTQRAYDGITPNQFTSINVNNVNETDFWLNQIDPDTGDILTSNLTDAFGQFINTQGEWVPVDVENGSNIVFNTAPQRNKYEIETLEDDQVRLIFGDGEFADIPFGTFDLWYRVSANEDLTIPRSSISGKNSAMQYLDRSGISQTLSFTFSLTNSLTNASASEDIEHIRRLAPLKYYSQNRMVNGPDYNNFPLQNPSILKLRTVNRTFAGDSSYIAWNDPSGRYSDIKIFGDDLVIFTKTEEMTNLVSFESATPSQLVTNDVEPLLSNLGLILFHDVQGYDYPEQSLSVATKANLISRITDAENAAGPLYPIFLEYYDAGPGWDWNIWDASESALPGYPDINDVSITIDHVGAFWELSHKDRHVNAESLTTRFWLEDYNNRTLLPALISGIEDTIVVLKANVNKDQTGALASNIAYKIIGNESQATLPDTGLPDITRINIVPQDTNADTIPDNADLSDFINQSTVFENILTGDTINLPYDYVAGYGEIKLFNQTGDEITFVSPVGTGIQTDELEVGITNFGSPSTVTVVRYDFVYFSRDDLAEELAFITDTYENKQAWYNDPTVGTDNTGKSFFQRYSGRSDVNFAWYHKTPRLNLIDPAPSNIHDMIVVTKGYYNDYTSWVDDSITQEPTLPTPFQLQTDYQDILVNKMISDQVIIQPGKFKLLFGNKAQPLLQAKFSVIRSSTTSLTNNEVKIKIVSIIKRFFNIDYWDFGESFFFTELATAIHAELATEIDSVLLVPLDSSSAFGDLMQINTREDEILQPHITVDDIEVVEYVNKDNIRQRV